MFSSEPVLACDENVTGTEKADYQFDTVEVRPRLFQVLRDGAVVPLEPKSIRVLIYLIEHRERAVGKEELLQAIWQDTAVTDNALTRVIAQLRRELGDDARQPRYIQTIPTLGYRFVGHIRTAAEHEPPPRPPKSNWRIFVVAAAALAAVCAIAWFATRPRPDPIRSGASVQLTTSAGLDIAPSFSPDGSSFAYSSDRGGSFEIYVRPVASAAREIQVTSDGGQNIQPVWSPDGRSIAYHSVRKRGIWVVPASGGTARQVVRSGSQPAWSPDSTRLAYRSDDAFSLSVNDLISATRTTLYVVPAAGGEPVRIAGTSSAAGRQYLPSWSPDGKRIIYAAMTKRVGELWTVAPDGSSPRRLLALDRTILISPVFGAGGRSVFYGAFAKTRDFGIWQQRLSSSGAAEGQPVEISRTGTSIPLHLAVSRDGKRLAYTALSSTSNLWAFTLDRAGAGGDPQPLYKDMVFRASFPSFSPDGKRIAFFARVFGGSGDIWVMNADGSGATPLTSNPSLEYVPQWSADGSSVIYSQEIDGGLELRRIAVADRSEMQLMEGRRLLGWPILSPDGTTIASHSLVYHSPGDDAPNVSTLPVRGGEPRQLTHDRDGAGFPVWSPDGKQIAYELLRGSNTYLAVMNRDGSGQTQLNSDAGHSWVHDWSPDGRKILFAGYRDGEWNIWWLDLKTREQKRLTDYNSLRNYVRYPAFSPQGDRIVYELGTTRGNIFRIDLE
jgi:Tol biopolymer transport system component/DNA-binding winged helix-turn-helix (wHTH) protein